MFTALRWQRINEEERDDDRERRRRRGRDRGVCELTEISLPGLARLFFLLRSSFVAPVSIALGSASPRFVADFVQPSVSSYFSTRQLRALSRSRLMSLRFSFFHPRLLCTPRRELLISRRERRKTEKKKITVEERADVR